MSRRRRTHGQALVEFALIAPLLFLTIGGIISLGIGVFYQQQLTNAAREAARYAAIHSATAQCPVVSNKAPRSAMLPPDVIVEDYDCDPPSLRWPNMTAHARSQVFGLSPSGVHISACWSGYNDGGGSNGYDAAPMNQQGQPNTFERCTIGGIDPAVNPGSIPCPPPLTTAADDKASSLAHSSVPTANQVTVYACYVWNPPFLGPLIGQSITMRAVITEAMQHQQ